MSTEPTRGRIWLAFATLYLSGGSVYLALRVMVQHGIPPLLGSSARFGIAGVTLLGLLAACGRSVRVTRRELAAMASLALLQFVVGNGAIALATRDLTSSLTALLASCISLWVIVLRWTAMRERVEASVLLGVAGGVAGLAVLLIPGHAAGAGSLAAVALGLGAPLAWAIGLLLTPRVPLPRDVLAAAGWMMAWGGAFLLIAGLALGEADELQVEAIPVEAWLALGHLVVVGSWLMFGSSLWLTLSVPPSQVATFGYVVPLVAVMLGALVLDEPITGATVLGGTLIVGAVALTARRSRAAPPSAPLAALPPAPGSARRRRA